MNSRRELLATLGVVTVAGCTADASQENTSQPDTETQPEHEQELSIPFDGLGMYEEAVRSAGPIEEDVSTGLGGVETTAEDIHNMLEQTSSVEEEQRWLAENTPVQHDELHQIMHTYHQAKNEKGENEDQVVANINWSFTGQSKPIAEFYTVQNGNLQSQPSITYQKGVELLTNHPDQQKPEPIANLRTDDRWSSTVPQDYDAFTDRYEDASEETKRSSREVLFDHWSRGLFGVDAQSNLIPHDAESSNVVFDGLYNEDGDTEAVVELNQQYAESEFTDTDEVVSAQYTGSGWEFEIQEDYELGDELPARQQ